MEEAPQVSHGRAGTSENLGSSLLRRRSLGSLRLDTSNFETSDAVNSKGRRRSEGDVVQGQLMKAAVHGIMFISSIGKLSTDCRPSEERVTESEGPERLPDGSAAKASAYASNGNPSNGSRPSSGRRRSKGSKGTAMTPKAFKRPVSAQKRPSSARSARSSLPPNARLFPPQAGAPDSSPRRFSVSVSPRRRQSSGGFDGPRFSASASPRRRQSSGNISGGRKGSLLDEVTKSTSGRRRRSDTDTRQSKAGEPLEETCIFAIPKTLMDRWTRRTIFQKARGVYAEGKASKVLETPLDMLHLAAKATHRGVHHTLLERHVIGCWQDAHKESAASRQLSEPETLASEQQLPELEVPPEVFLEDLKGLASKLGEMKKVVKTELLPESIHSALHKIDLKLDKFDKLHDLLFMHNSDYEELSSKMASQLDQCSKIIASLTKDFRSFRQSVQEEMANPKTDSANLKAFLPAVEHCLVTLGILAKEREKPDITMVKELVRTCRRGSHQGQAHTQGHQEFDYDEKRASRASQGERRWSQGATARHLPTETKIVSEHDAPEVLLYDGEKQKGDDDSSLGGFSDEYQLEADHALDAEELLTTTRSSASADPPLQADPALQVDRGESVSPVSSDELPMGFSKTEPLSRPSLESPLRRSNKKQKTWQTGSKKDYQWQAVSAKLEREFSPCPSEVATMTCAASSEVCEAYGISLDELGEITKFLKCDDILDIGKRVEELVKDLGGVEEAIATLRTELGEELLSKLLKETGLSEEILSKASERDGVHLRTFFVKALACTLTTNNSSLKRHLLRASANASPAISSATPCRNPPAPPTDELASAASNHETSKPAKRGLPSATPCRNPPAPPTDELASAASNHETSKLAKRGLPIKDRIQVAKPSQPRSKSHRYNRPNVKRYPEDCSTDTLSVLQTKLLATIVDKDGQTGDLLQIVNNATPPEYLPQAPRPETPIKVNLPWDDYSDTTCQGRPRTTGSIGVERWEGLPSVRGAEQGIIGKRPYSTPGSSRSRPSATPGFSGSHFWHNQLTTNMRPMPGSYQSLMWRRNQLNPHSLPVILQRV